MLQLAKQHYSFCQYTAIQQKNEFIIWRHDVDFSMHAAVKLAQIEAEEGIAATYFLLMHSEFYNLFERSIIDRVRIIIELGHTIALHFDASIYDVRDETSLEFFLRKEKEFIETNFGQKIEVFSFHNPNPTTLQYQQWRYADMINTYAAYFQQEVGYCSDSNGYWRFDSLAQVLGEHKHPRLQVLTHPEWWTEEPLSPRARVMRCIQGRAIANEKFYDNLLNEHGRLNVK
jgi:hypothetical protein